MQNLTIAFDGLCCHIDPPTPSIPAVRRTILPDASGHDVPHISYIECFATNFDPASNPTWPYVAYSRHHNQYVRIEVKNVEIKVANAVLSPALVIEDSFLETVPQLKLVCPSFTVPREDLLKPVMPSGAVAAFFDMDKGVLSAGPPESRPTKFTPQRKWPKRHLAEWGQLDLKIDDAPPTLVITGLDPTNNVPAALTFKTGTRLITIGNQTLRDILGLPPVQPGHFIMYYSLATAVAEKPVPEFGLGLGPGCSNSGWP